MPLRIDIITCCPELLDSPLNFSIVGRAKKKGLAEIYVHNLRDYTLDKHRKVDDYAFGFGAGMVLQIEPIDRCISALKQQRDYDEVIFTAPDGERFTQQAANSLSLFQNLIILCRHYKGVDQRVRDHLITKEYSIGDYVLTGGEMPAAIMTDAIVRLLPGALGDVESALKTVCSKRVSIHDRRTITDGKYPTFCYPDTKPKWKSTSSNRALNTHANAALTYYSNSAIHFLNV